MEEYDPDLRSIRGVRIYDQMRKSDPVIATGLRLITWTITQSKWRVDPGGKSSADIEAAKFLESCMHDMSSTWIDFIRENLTMLAFGWVLNEIVYKVRNGQDANPPSRYDDGRIGWRKSMSLSQESLLRWEFDPKDGSLLGMTQQLENGGAVTVPIEKCVLFRMEKERNNPEGNSLLRPAYGPWYKKTNIEEIEAIGIERDLTGVLIIKPPIGASEDDKDQAIKLLEQYKADDMTGFVAPRVVSGPDGAWDFQIINSPGNKSIDTDKVLQRYELQIMRAFLTQFLMLGGTSGGGSYALAWIHENAFQIAIQSILQTLEETINRFMVVPLFRVNNFPGITKLPQIKSSKIAKPEMDKFAKAMNDLITAGALTPGRDLEDFIRTEFNFPPLGIETPNYEKKSPAPGQSPIPEPKTEVPKKTELPASNSQQAAEYDTTPEDWPTTFEGAEDELEWDCDTPYEARSVVSRIFSGTGAAPIDVLRNEIDDAGDDIEKQVQDYKEGHITRDSLIAAILLFLAMTERKALQLAQKRLNPKAIAIDDEYRKIASAYHNTQMGYFREFIPEMAGLSAAQLAARARLYIQSSEGLFHTVIVAGLAGLAAKTGTERWATWRMSAAEHCATCVGYSGKSWLVNKLPAVPRGGSTICKSNCRCYLTYSDKAPNAT